MFARNRSDVVYCHLCTSGWFRGEWSLICPHCESETVEVIEVQGDSPTTEDFAGVAETLYLSEGRFDLEREMRRNVESKGDTPGEEVVIAVMGVTGSGKSTFIRTMTGDSGINVGHGLESDTSEVNSYRFSYRNIQFVLVDTPGFNDTTCSDEVVMTRVLEWLELSFRSGTRLNGLIYLHRIIDPKIQGSALNNMRMFRKLCGPECFQNIILATTFWEDVAADIGAQREQQLKGNDEFWGKMVKKGSAVRRLGTSRESGMEILLDIARKQKITLQSQQEMVGEHKSARETAAALAFQEELQRQKEEFERQIEEQRLDNKRKLKERAIMREQALEKERQRAAKDERRRVMLEDARKQREDEIWRIEYDRQQKKLREEREERERERKRREVSERKLKEAEERRQREQERLREERKRYYDNYSCQRVYVTSMRCDKCYTSVRSGWYYHCCFCLSDNYDQCQSCGGCCPVLEHPYMKMRYKTAPRDDDCVIM